MAHCLLAREGWAVNQKVDPAPVAGGGVAPAGSGHRDQRRQQARAERRRVERPNLLDDRLTVRRDQSPPQIEAH
jgi:hypothetical protein